MNNWENMTIEELIRRDKELSQQIAAQEKEWESHPVSSGFNEDTLRQAIDDAKAVRATALANARLALEEAFAEKSAEMDIEIRKQILLHG